MYYRQCAKDKADLREWLVDLAPRIKSDVLRRLHPFKAIHDFHCTAEQRSEAIDDVLRECLELQTQLFSANVIGITEDQQPQDMLVPSEPLGTKSKLSRKRTALFPNRAAWLSQRLAEREWDHNDLPRYGGPDRKTVLKVLAGGQVNDDVLGKLVKSLSFSAKAKKPTILDIPLT